MKSLLLFSLLSLMSFSTYADSCREWTTVNQLVTMRACSYSSGKSGYIEITNNGYSPASICWDVIYNDGRVSNGCNSYMGSGESTTPSCASCGSNNVGVRTINITKYQVRN